MKAIEDNGKPAIVINEHDEFGETKTVMHCMDIDSARQLRNELTKVIDRLTAGLKKENDDMRTILTQMAEAYDRASEHVEYGKLINPSVLRLPKEFLANDKVTRGEAAERNHGQAD